MAFAAHVLRVMMASHGDVTGEYGVVCEEARRWNEAYAGTRGLMLHPVKFAAAPQQGALFQAAPNRRAVEEADILIGVFGSPAGSPSENSVIDAAESIKRHVAAGKTARVYFSENHRQIDPVESAALQAFKEECDAGGLAMNYRDLGIFESLLRQYLSLELNQPRYRWMPEAAPQVQEADDSLTIEAKQMLVTATLSHGMVSTHPSLGGEVIRAGREIFTDGTPRRTAVLKEALQQLRSRGHIEPSGPRPGIFSLTASGYRVADKLIEDEKTHPESSFRIKAVPRLPAVEHSLKPPASN